MSPQEVQARIVQTQIVFVAGNDLVEMMREYDKWEKGDPHADLVDATHFLAYVTGVHDATWYKYSVPAEATRAQLAAVVSKFLKQNPKKWSHSAFYLVEQALTKAFPKRAIR
jgi:hypothetical protein